MSDVLAQLRDRACRNPRRIVYPESADPRILHAVTTIVQKKMAKPILIGSPAVVEEKAKAAGLTLQHIALVDGRSSALIDRYVRILLPEWRARGITEIEAGRRLENPMYLAAAM